MPFISGSEISSTTTSGTSWIAMRSAVRPSRASPTMTKSGSAPTSAFRPASTTGWSSTIRTRMGAGVTDASQRYPRVDCRAALGAGFDLEAAARQGKALADAEEAEVADAKVEVSRAARGVEAATVILDDQPNLFIGRLQDHADPIGAGMLNDIGDRLLQYTEDGCLDRLRQARIIQVDLQVNLQPGAFGPLLQVLGNGHTKPEIIQRPWPKLPGDTTEFAADLSGEAFQLSEALLGRCIAGAQRFDIGETKPQRGEVLPETVVQLARDPLALGLLRGDGTIEQHGALLGALLEARTGRAERADDGVGFQNTGFMLADTFTTAHHLGVADEVGDRLCDAPAD